MLKIPLESTLFRWQKWPFFWGTGLNRGADISIWSPEARGEPPLKGPRAGGGARPLLRDL